MAVNLQDKNEESRTDFTLKAALPKCMTSLQDTVYRDDWGKGPLAGQLEAPALLSGSLSEDISVSVGALSSHLERTFGKFW